jgi:hypothetical protein
VIVIASAVTAPIEIATIFLAAMSASLDLLRARARTPGFVRVVSLDLIGAHPGARRCQGRTRSKLQGERRELACHPPTSSSHAQIPTRLLAAFVAYGVHKR